MISREKELLHMQLRLFRMACHNWHLDNHACADIFDRFQLDDYIESGYEIFHVQGDEANMQELSAYARSKGADI